MATWNMEQLADDLQEVAIYPERWPAVLETMCAVTGAYGGLLFSTEKRLIRPPGTANLDKMVEDTRPRNGTSRTFALRLFLLCDAMVS